MNDNNQQNAQGSVTEPTALPPQDSGPVSPVPDPITPNPISHFSSPDGSEVADPSSVPSVPMPPPEPATQAAEPSTAPVLPSSETSIPSPDLSTSNVTSFDNSSPPADQPKIAPSYDQSASKVAPLITDADSDDLLGIKRQALQSLAPLVDELDQTPEEKFKTTMMLIQASDNADLVKDAFAAANQITDEKSRAQALLDVVNEINYFTQPHQDDSEPV